MMIWSQRLAMIAAVAGGCAAMAAAQAPRFELSFPATASSHPVTGRAFVFMSHAGTPEPRLQAGGYNGNIPFFGHDFSQVGPGQVIAMDASDPGAVVKSLREVPAGDYYVQGLINVYTRFPRADGHVIWAHMDQWEGQQFNRSPGNFYSRVQQIHWDPRQSQTIRLTLDQIIPPVQLPPDTAWVKHVKMQSPMLTHFWGHPIFMGATVLLPAGYDQHPSQTYPVVYVQGHFSLRAPYGFDPSPSEPNAAARQRRAVDGIETGYEFYQAWTAPDFPRMIVVTLQHPTPYYDDSYAVNSVNTGPYGDAIVEELIPYVETHFRINRKPSARMLTGGSTGGWESLDLELKHPDFFGGTWTFYPDPLDFHHFQLVNLYDDANAFWAPAQGRGEAHGETWTRTPRYMDRQVTGQPDTTEEQMSQAEYAEGTRGRSGQQLDVFFATFGPMDTNGYPTGFWDLQTGVINKDAVAWGRDHGYDLTAYTKQHWGELGPKIFDKIHVYVGDMDTYYLNLGVYDLQNFMLSTTNPHYEGTFVFGRPEKPHGWNGDMTNAELLRQIYKAVKP